MDHPHGWRHGGLRCIEERIKERAKLLTPIEMPYDPFQAAQLVTHLADEGIPMVEFGATVKNFSEPMKQLEALVASGKLHHNGNPVLTWCISNVVCHTDAKDNVFPRKDRAEYKIDGAVAAIMAMGRALAAPVDDGTITQGFVVL